MKSVVIVLLWFLLSPLCCSDDGNQNAGRRSDDDQETDTENGKTDTSEDDGKNGESAGDGDVDSDGDADTGESDDGDDSDTGDESNDDDDTEEENNSGNDGDTEEEICNAIDMSLEAAPVRIMILEDMSSSMREGIPTKWEQAKQALTNMLNTFNDTVEFGFDRFPAQTRCAVRQTPLIDCASDNGDNIINLFNSLSLSQSTPLYMAMQNYTNQDYAPALVKPGATKYLLIVSDGKDSCGTTNSGGLIGGGAGSSVTAAQFTTLTTSLLEESDIMTYVIGFGDQASPEQLNAIAAAGGTNVTTYFDAQDQTQLETALNEIVGSTVSCVFDIGEQDENEIDLNQVNVYFDGEILGYDEGCAAGKGWTWVDDSKTKLEFCEKACNKIKKDKVEEVSATFGCPTHPIV